MELKSYTDWLRNTALKVLELSNKAVLDVLEKDYNGTVTSIETVGEFYRQIEEAYKINENLPKEIKELAGEIYNILSPVVGNLMEIYDELKEHGWTAKAWSLARIVASNIPIAAYKLGSLLR